MVRVRGWVNCYASEAGFSSSGRLFKLMKILRWLWMDGDQKQVSFNFCLFFLFGSSYERQQQLCVLTYSTCVCHICFIGHRFLPGCCPGFVWVCFLAFMSEKLFPRLDFCLVLIIRAELIITICLPVKDLTRNDQQKHPGQSNKHCYSLFMPSCRPK